MWLWSDHVVEELLRRDMVDTALALGDRQVAARYDGPAVRDLGDAALLALAGLLCPDPCGGAGGSVTAAT